MPPKFLENIVILCFERRFSKQNSVIRLKSNILPPPNFWAGYATDSRGSGQQDLPRTWSLSNWRGCSIFRFYEFNSCALCLEVSHHAFFEKISSPLLIFAINSSIHGVALGLPWVTVGYYSSIFAFMFGA